MPSETVKDTGNHSSTTWIILAGLLTLRLLLGVAYSALNPLGEAPDEADHYAYAAYISHTGQLPVGTSLTQAKHPPLYHLLAALAASGAGMDFAFLRSNPDVGFVPGAAPNFFVHTTLEGWPWRDGALAMHLGRLVSVLAGVLLVLGTYALGRTVWPGRPEAALAAACFVAFLPESLFIGGSMSNDTLTAMFATWALWAGLRSGQIGSGACRQKMVFALLAGLCLGLAFLSKASAIALAPVIGLAIVLPALRFRPGTQARQAGTTPGSVGAGFPRPWPPARRVQPLRSGSEPSGSGTRLPRPYALRGVSFELAALPPVCAAGGMTLLLGAPWLWRNWRLYGDPLGWPVVLGTIDRRQGPLGWREILAMLHGWLLSFWGKFGGAGQIALPAPFYIVWFAILALAVAGWLKWAATAYRAPHRKGSSLPATVGDQETGNREQGSGLFPIPGSVLPDATPLRSGGWDGLQVARSLTLWASPVLVALSIISYGTVALGTDQGRLLFPAIAPLALLLVGGLSAWLPARYARTAVAVWGVGLACVALLALDLGIVQTFAPPIVPPGLTGNMAVGQDFGPALRLAGLQWQPGPAGSVTLYWQAQEGIHADLRTDLRLLDSAGALVWEWKRSPDAGRLSTDHWTAGYRVADIYQIPAGALSRTAHAELAVYTFPNGPWLAPAGSPAGKFFATLPGP